MTAPGHLHKWEPSPIMRQVRDDVARAFLVEPQALVGRSRSTYVVQVRNAACWVVREKFGLSYPQIGVLMGGRDHSTVIHARDNAIAQRESDARYRAMTDALLRGDPPETMPLLEEQKLLHAVAAAFHVQVADLTGRSRVQVVTLAREAACWVLRHRYNLDWPALGMALGGRDRTTVSHLWRVANRRQSHDRAFRMRIAAVLDQPCDDLPQLRPAALRRKPAADPGELSVRARIRADGDDDALNRFEGTLALAAAIAASGGRFR